MTPRAARGFTLLEVTIAASIAAMLFLVIGALTRTATLATDQLARSQQIDRNIERAFRELAKNLKASSMAGIVIDSTHPDFDVLTLQIPDPSHDGDPIAYGFPGPDASFQTGWSAEYRVEGRSLVRRTRDHDGRSVGSDEVLCPDVDTRCDTGEGLVKGFAVAQHGPLVDVLIRVRETLLDRGDLVREERTTIRQVNP